MRTTLTIDDDVLQVAKEIGRHERRPAGAVISDYFRRAYDRRQERPNASSEANQAREAALAALGIERFPSRGGIVTNADIDRLRDELGI